MKSIRKKWKDCAQQRNNSPKQKILNRIQKTMLACAGALFTGIGVWAATDNVAEEVAWVIGDQPLWKSEIEEYYQQMLYDRVTVDGDPYCVIPEMMAIEKLYLHQAEVDTVEVSSSMIAQRVDGMLSSYVNSLGSKEKVEQYFNKPFNTLRENLTDMITNRNKVEMVQSSLTKDVKATPAQVKQYFSTLSTDSVPFVPQQVEVQLLTIAPPIPQEAIDDVKARLRDYADRVNSGESEFSTLAILYSEDPGSRTRGGELGFMGRGQLVPEFSAVAFNLQDPKKVSKIVQTEFGYHIIQLIEKRGDRINCRHILLKPKVDDKALIDAMNRLDSLRTNMIESGKATFEEAVAAVSSDKDTRNNRGVMMNPQTGNTRFEMAQLPQEIGKVVDKLAPGEVSKPFLMKDQKTGSDIVAMVKLTNRIDAHRANINDDYQTIKSMYEDAKKESILRDWVEKKIADTYVRIEPGWRNCTFKHKGWVHEEANGND